jgi:A/G-specific adenine glycosylase
MLRTDDPLYNFHVWFKEQTTSQSLDWDLVCLEFQQAIWQFYNINKRPFIWRDTHEPYHIVVSEIMLQQTQTQRIAQKFPEFIEQFPTFASLAQASTQELLSRWIGLGYNRRAFALQWIAQKVVSEYGGVLPNDPQVLETFKGIGPATAASITAFAFNKPTIFIETNVRAVFLHTFFSEHKAVPDKILLPLVAKTVDQQNAREWYYALMDYGVVIKKLYPNPSRKSKHHTKQSKFEGSDRQVRGAIVKLLTQKNKLTATEIYELFPKKQDKIELILAQLCSEKLLQCIDNTYSFE